LEAAARERHEAELSALHEAGDYERTAVRLVEGYGPEVVGYLTVMLGSSDEAQDAFQTVCEDIVVQLPGFRRAASFRTWLYVIARRRAIKLRSRRGKDVPLSRSPTVSALIDRARTATAAHLRTDVKDAVRELRAQLSEEERSLLVLRVDRGMDWRQIAPILGADEKDIDRDAARLRKRFQRVKVKLRAMMQQAGLLPREDDDDEPR
jgi:RNA polymerase sigma-70 factor, ECF subfamily